MKRIDIEYGGRLYSIGGRELVDVLKEVEDGVASGGATALLTGSFVLATPSSTTTDQSRPSPGLRSSGLLIDRFTRLFGDLHEVFAALSLIHISEPTRRS